MFKTPDALPTQEELQALKALHQEALARRAKMLPEASEIMREAYDMELPGLTAALKLISTPPEDAIEEIAKASTKALSRFMPLIQVIASVGLQELQLQMFADSFEKIKALQDLASNKKAE